jgi:hypothetical protein
MKAEGRRQKAKGKDFRHSILHARLPGAVSCAIRHGAAAVVVAAALCAGCGPQPYVMEGNYLTYDHPFSETSAAAVRKNAEGTCRQRGQAAVETSRACSLTQCTTSYQCMDEVDAKRLAGEKK